MARIHYDEENINAFILPNINQTIENLNKAISSSLGLNVTADLSTKSEINDLDIFLSDKNDRVKRIKNIIEKSHKIAFSSSEEVKTRISSLSQGVLDKKQSRI